MTHPDLIYTTHIKTTPEKLWQAITTPAFARQYWGDCAAFSSWEKGAKWTLERVGAKVLNVIGEVVECTPPKRLVLTWASPDAPQDISRVSFDIEPAKDLVRLTVIHGHFMADSSMAGQVSKGWPLVLSSLKSFLETGTPIDILSIKPACGSPTETAA